MRKLQGLGSFKCCPQSRFLPSFAVKDCYKEMLTEVSYLQGLMSANMLWYEH